MKTSKAPWNVSYSDTGGYDCITPAYTVTDDAGKPIAVLDLKDYGWRDAGKGLDILRHQSAGNSQALANAGLMCAAPDLLVALEGIIDIGKRDMSNPKYDGYFTAAREAIARAKGR